MVLGSRLRAIGIPLSAPEGDIQYPTQRNADAAEDLLLIVLIVCPFSHTRRDREEGLPCSGCAKGDAAVSREPTPTLPLDVSPPRGAEAVGRVDTVLPAQ